MESNVACEYPGCTRHPSKGELRFKNGVRQVLTARTPMNYDL